MARVEQIVLTVALGLAVVCAAAPAPAPAAATAESTLASIPSSQFVYHPTTPALNTAVSGGGSSSQRLLAQWPALKGTGISQTAFNLNPCSLRPPHTHPYASGLLYATSANNLQVGFVMADGTSEPVVNNITTGASALFPQGLIHYQLNLDCQPASYTISYSSEEPETQTVVNGLLGLPRPALQAALGFSSGDFDLWQAQAPTSKFIQVADADCAARCGLSSNATVISFSTHN
ncbi:hypothetical protein WJX74_007381 [Apatococcus lobatus]|uniref:Germin-like protein n=2 Tax=Apatococcus TaxID=904362 RepID=A0AAW1TBC5_9CHLO